MCSVGQIHRDIPWQSLKLKVIMTWLKWDSIHNTFSLKPIPLSVPLLYTLSGKHLSRRKLDFPPRSRYGITYSQATHSLFIGQHFPANIHVFDPDSLERSRVISMEELDMSYNDMLRGVCCSHDGRFLHVAMGPKAEGFTSLSAFKVIATFMEKQTK